MMTSSNGNIFRGTGLDVVTGEIPAQGQWRGALMFSLICSWTNSLSNTKNAGDLGHHRSHYDVIVMPEAIWHLRVEWWQLAYKWNRHSNCWHHCPAFNMSSSNALACSQLPYHDFHNTLCVHPFYAFDNVQTEMNIVNKAALSILT